MPLQPYPRGHEGMGTPSLKTFQFLERSQKTRLYVSFLQSLMLATIEIIFFFLNAVSQTVLVGAGFACGPPAGALTRAFEVGASEEGPHGASGPPASLRGPVRGGEPGGMGGMQELQSATGTLTVSSRS